MRNEYRLLLGIASVTCLSLFVLVTGHTPTEGQTLRKIQNPALNAIAPSQNSRVAAVEPQGQQLAGITVVEMDAGVALLKARGNTLADAISDIDPNTGQCKTDSDSPLNAMDCAKTKIESAWERDYGESINNSTTFLGVGYQRVFYKGKSPDQIFTALNYLYAWAAQSARVKIASQIGLKFSASDKARVPGPELDTSFEDEVLRLERAKRDLRGQITRLASQVDPVEAAAAESELRYLNNSPSFNDRALRFVDAIIKKLDPDFDPKVFAQETKAGELTRQQLFLKKAQELRGQLNSLEIETREIDKKINTAKNTLSFNVSGGSSVDKSLFGVTVIDTRERVDISNGTIEVAVLSVWSPQLDLVGSSIMTGNQVRVKAQSAPRFLKNAPSVDNAAKYLLQLPLTGIIGSHLVITSSGEYKIIGASIFPEKKGNISSRQSARMVRFFARFHLNCSVYSHTVQEEKVKGELKANDESFSLSSTGFTNTDTSCGSPTGDSERQVSGERNVMFKRFVHPKFNIPALLQVYEISSSNANISRKVQGRNSVAHAQAIKAIKYWQGYTQGLEANVERAKRSNASKRQGIRDARSDINEFNKGTQRNTQNPVPERFKPRAAPRSQRLDSYSGGRGSIK